MNWQINPFSILLIIFSILLVVVGWTAWQRRRAPGSLPLALFLSTGRTRLYYLRKSPGETGCNAIITTYRTENKIGLEG